MTQMDKRKVLLYAAFIVICLVCSILFFRYKRQQDAWRELEQNFIPLAHTEIHTIPHA